jgi:hypothetical protein
MRDPCGKWEEKDSPIWVRARGTEQKGMGKRDTAGRSLARARSYMRDLLKMALQDIRSTKYWCTETEKER